MIGEDGNTCMSIRARQKGTNRGLVAYLLHGNCRVLGVKDSSGRLVARAIARLLLDDTTGTPVIYVEAPYGDLYDPVTGAARDALLEIFDQAATLGRLLKTPIVYSCRPPEADYFLGELEIDACSGLPSADTSSAGASRMILPLLNLTDYSSLAPHTWVDGIKAPGESAYYPMYQPSLHKVIPEGVHVGFRSFGSLEAMRVQKVLSLESTGFLSDNNMTRIRPPGGADAVRENSTVASIVIEKELDDVAASEQVALGVLSVKNSSDLWG
jgi:hypothetical protein